MLGGGSVGRARTAAQGGGQPPSPPTVMPGRRQRCPLPHRLGEGGHSCERTPRLSRQGWSRRISWALSWAFDSLLIKSAVRRHGC